MRTYIAAIAIGLAVFSACSGEKENNNNLSTDTIKMEGDLPVITFEENEHDFGTMTEGEVVTYAFKFKNTGKSDLVISSARGSCGCTVTDPPKHPIPPGGEDKISVTFNSQGKAGMNHKDVTVVTNCQPNTVIIKFTANVLKAEDKQE